MVDFVLGLQAAAAGLSVLKELNKVDNEYDKAGLKLKIAELSSALATVQITLAEAQSEAAKKNVEIAKLQSNFKQKTEMVEHEGFMYRRSSNGRPLGRAYCPRCLDSGLLMMTTEWKNGTRCPECKNEYFQMIFGFEGR
jgi:predicted Zn-ribbon and HTH transcriptional regulator